MGISLAPGHVRRHEHKFEESYSHLSDSDPLQQLDHSGLLWASAFSMSIFGGIWKNRF